MALNASQLNTVRQHFDSLISDYTEECRLIYPASRNQCPNCIWDASRQASSGKYKAGGPIPFSGSSCPYCQGKGYSVTEESELVQFKIIWLSFSQISRIVKIAGERTVIDENLSTPYSVLETRFFHTDVPKVYRATDIVVQTPTEGFARQKFARITEPNDVFSLIKGRYFSCYWAQHG